MDLRTLNTETYGARDVYDKIDILLRPAVCVSNTAAFAIGAFAYTGRLPRLAAHLRLQMRHTRLGLD